LSGARTGALSLIAASRSIGFWMRRQQVSLLVFPNVLMAPCNLEMNVGGTFAVDAFNLMVAFRATHADVSLADIDRLPSTGLIDLGADVIAHLSRSLGCRGYTYNLSEASSS